MKCIIIEDQPPAQRLLQKYITDFGALTLLGTFSDALTAMHFLESNSVDLIFLDIHLPKLSGLNFLKTLQRQPNVILTTAFPEYALESYEYSVIDYLLKPFSFERFVKAVKKVPTKQTEKPTEILTAPEAVKEEIYIKTGYEHIRVPLNEIIYIKSDADFTEVYVSKQKKHLTYDSLRYWADTLTPNGFYRMHKSYIINLAKVQKIATNVVVLQDDIKIPIGRSYKDDFLKEVLGK
ncbi:two component transcriptional regulator, LytTR family [Pustulibacterium marinum]|uniref:Two component transcriptional regulator, LytTR family n=1 Tax=Pustulibacterium marinum TaxID=1224947 RepID=A0A1I7IMN8_9FLAO|nr:LytTR family DNA-binding domain-containing protein [Pustulibacterium marinum]SFU74179.1 two component transcriptional regulator, LytTR family [Pustulibacterium marinum]